MQLSALLLVAPPTGAVGTVRVLAATLSLIGRHAVSVNPLLSKNEGAHTYNILKKPIPRSVVE